jgi:hypothetical protein
VEIPVRRPKPISLACLGAWLGLAQTASAALIVPVSQEHRAETFVSTFPPLLTDAETVVPPGLGSFDQTASVTLQRDEVSITGTATHSAIFRDDAFYASGSASVTVVDPTFFFDSGGSSSVRFALTFEVVEAVDALLQVSLTADFASDGLETSGIATVSGPSGVIASTRLHLTEVEALLDLPARGAGPSGRLLPGQYTLDVSAVAGAPEHTPGENRVAYSISFEAVPVPEPRSLLLLASGLMALASRGRLRRS